MKKKFNSVLIIGMGLIGSSISRALTENHVAKHVYGLDSDDKVIKKCLELNLLIQGETNFSKF
jgi:Prephenate dehydrogenase